MGRKARLKQERKLQAKQEAWDHFRGPMFLREVRRMILSSGAQADSCICSVKVLCQLGESLGVRVEPLTVEAYVYNQIFVDFFAEQGFNPTTEDFKRLGEAGGRFIVLGSRESRDAVEGKWQGHLVAIAHPPKGVNDVPYVLDISIDQAHRPQKKLMLQDPVCFPIPSKRFLTGEQDAVGLTESAGTKMCMVYRAHPAITDYEVSPDWQRDYAAKTHKNVAFDDLADTVERADPPPPPKEEE